MACEEARSLLDSLMGGDRNAPLPPGAAVPTKRKHSGSDAGTSTGTALLLPGKRQKSCFDRDIDPLYTAWGIDVYDLFINTKSDLGTNPYVVDEGAHREFQSLPPEEQDRTGYHYFLFQKLQELVRQCDRTVARNKEKLHQELQRKLSQRGGQDFVEDVDDSAVEALLVDIVQLEELTVDWKNAVCDLDQVVAMEDMAKRKLEPLLEAQKVHEQSTEQNEESANQQQENESHITQGVKVEGGNNDDKTTSKDTKIDDYSNQEVDDVDQRGNDESTRQPMLKREDEVENQGPDSILTDGNGKRDGGDQLDKLRMELGQLTMRKQRLLFEIARIMSRLTPLQEAVENQHRQLNYVKSDISTDKTVCEVSGNFMSSRDADERIAAHYAGKQYVGWKLVRDKFAEMVQKYGRNGPPPPSQGGPRDMAAPNHVGGLAPSPSAQHQPPPTLHRGMPPPAYGRNDTRGGGPSPRGGGYYDDRGGTGMPYENGGGGGGGYRGPGGDRGGRWERQPVSHQDRGRNAPPPRGGNWRR